MKQNAFVDVANAAEKLVKLADAAEKALNDRVFSDDHYTHYIDAAEELVKTIIDTNGENTRFLIVVLRAIADELENY